MLSVIVPCYNEALNIPLIVSAFSKAIDERKDVEIILVNNGSTDQTALILDNMLDHNSNKSFRSVHVKINKGYGYGILSGLMEAKGSVLAWTHADMQTEPKDVITAYEKFLECNDSSVLIKGSRINREFHAWMFSWGMGVMASLLLNNNLEEINAQPKVFSRSFYERFLKDTAPHDFSLDLFACYWANKYGKIHEIPVVVNKREHGDAKGGGSIPTKVKLISRTFNYILQFRKQINKAVK